MLYVITYIDIHSDNFSFSSIDYNKSSRIFEIKF